MALEIINKQSITITGFNLKSKFIELMNRFLNKSNIEVQAINVNLVNKLSEFKEKELSKFDNGFTTKVNLYSRKFF